MIDWISDPFGEDFDDLKNKVKVGGAGVTRRRSKRSRGSRRRTT